MTLPTSEKFNLKASIEFDHERVKWAMEGVVRLNDRLAVLLDDLREEQYPLNAFTIGMMEDAQIAIYSARGLKTP